MKNEIIKYSLKNLWERKARSFLTVLSIMIGIASIFIFASFGLGLYSYVGTIAEEAGVDIFWVQAKSGGAPGIDDTFKLEDKDLEAVGRTRGVLIATGMYMKPAEIEKDTVKKYVYLAGHSDKKEDIELFESLMTVKIDVGRQFKKGDSGKAILGYNYQIPDKIFSKPYKLGDKISINGEKFEILGFYESIGNPSDDSNVYILEEDMKRLFDDITYAMIMAKVIDKERIDSVIESTEKELRKVRDLEEGKEDFSVMSFEDALATFTSVLNIIIGFIFLIVIISAIVASVNTANTMITSVIERIREIGVMKSIGATNNSIRDIFLLESAIIGFVAGVIGVFVGWGLSYIGGQILLSLGWGFLEPVFPLGLWIGEIILSTCVGMISGFVPAHYASKQKPVDALRYE